MHHKILWCIFLLLISEFCSKRESVFVGLVDIIKINQLHFVYESSIIVINKWRKVGQNSTMWFKYPSFALKRHSGYVDWRIPT